MAHAINKLKLLRQTKSCHKTNPPSTRELEQNTYIRFHTPDRNGYEMVQLSYSPHSLQTVVWTDNLHTQPGVCLK